MARILLRKYMEEKDHTIKYTVVAIIGVLVLISVIAFISPQYGVWSKTLSGKGHLKEAEYNRQIQVVEAEAKAHAAKSLAEAEINRAYGVAKAIIGVSLKNNEQYLRWLWIEGLQHTQNQIIYVPTEANLPILEAGKR